MPGCIGTGAAEGSYPMLEVRGSGREEQSHIQGAVAVQVQEAERSYFTFKVRKGNSSKGRSSGSTLLKQP